MLEEGGGAAGRWQTLTLSSGGTEARRLRSSSATCLQLSRVILPSSLLQPSPTDPRRSTAPALPGERMAEAWRLEGDAALSAKAASPSACRVHAASATCLSQHACRMHAAVGAASVGSWAWPRLRVGATRLMPRCEGLHRQATQRRRD